VHALRERTRSGCGACLWRRARAHGRPVLAQSACARELVGVGGHERFEARAAQVERAVAEEVSEEWEGPGEYHLSEPVNPVGEGLARLYEASRPRRREKVGLGAYA